LRLLAVVFSFIELLAVKVAINSKENLKQGFINQITIITSHRLRCTI